MRILAMVHGYPPHHNAGGEMTMHSLLAHMAAQGHTVEVLVSRPMKNAPGPYEIDGVEVYTHLNDRDPFKWLTSPVRRPDVVITHLENTLRAAALCNIHKIPLVHLVHNDHDWTKGCIRRGPVNLAIYNSAWMAESYARDWARYSSNPQPPHVVVNPVIAPGLFERDPGEKRGTQIGLINLFEDKGGALFWELARELPQHRFLGVKGAYGEQVIPDERPSNVMLLPTQPPTSMPEIYRRLKILLMPSAYESWGRTSVEAALMGVPTIAHPTPGLTEALGDAGTFVDRKDIEGWKAAISRLSTPKGWAKASQLALARAAEIHRPEAQLRTAEKAIEGVVRRGFATLAR